MNSLFGLTQIHGLATQQDAIDLYAIFQTHGLDLLHYSYGDQSSHLDKLIEVLEMPINKAKIECLQLTEPYALMKALQVSFEQNLGEQTTANALLRAMESATSLQTKMIVALRNFLHYVDVIYSIDASWGSLYQELDEVVKAAQNSKQTAPKAVTATTETI